MERAGNPANGLPAGKPWRNGRRRFRNESFHTSSTYDSTSDYSDSETHYYSDSRSTEYCSESYTATSSSDLESGTSTSKYRRSSRPRLLSSKAGGWFPDDYLKTLGKGHFGQVNLAYCRTKKQFFAVKCARRARRTCRSTARSLKREAEILKKLDSPYVVKYLGERKEMRPLKIGNARGRTSVVTEIYLQYVKRGTLANFIAASLQRRRKLRESVIQHYTKQILTGIHYIHSKGIVHCDIKGSNILMGENHIKLSDFGVAKYRCKISETKRNGLISRAGTRAWMAPEVQARESQGFASDIWSLGCTVVQMITGKPPNSPQQKSFLESIGELDEEDYDILTFPKEFHYLSDSCVGFLGKCFLKDPKTRWTSLQLLRHPFLSDVVEHSPALRES